jgi:2',3'-cyclic-nucleotide 2'-phosphodiesterase (5'-nucleotidase family)
MNPTAKWLWTAALLALCATGPAFAETDSPADLTIVHTGDGLGHIEPQGCCDRIGGMARRATEIRKIRAANPHVLVVDSGNFMSRNPRDRFPSIRAEHVHRALSVIDYDALNVAGAEMAGGEHFAAFLRSEPDAPLVSLNVAPADGGPAPWPAYRILPAGNLRVALVGLAAWPGGRSPASPYAVASPEARLRERLPEIRKQADVIVLLSHVGWEATRALAKEFPAIDLAISGYDAYPDFEPETIGRTRLVKNAAGGGLLGVVRLWVDESRRVRRSESQMLLLEEKHPPDPDFARLESDFRARIAAARAEEKAAQAAAFHREAARFLEMSPEQFMEQMKAQNQPPPPETAER